MREYISQDGDFLIPKKDSKPYKVLLCEDKDINQLMGISALESLGCDVDLAPDGVEAVAMARKNNYDIIFMDCSMPKLDGFEATTQIRKLKGQYTPIIALTARVMLGDREKCLENGMDDYMPKPVRRDAICKMINKWSAQDSNILYYKNEW